MIRSAVRTDCLAIATIALANDTSNPENTNLLTVKEICSRLEVDGFDCNPSKYFCEVLCEKDHPENILAYCLYYYTYSTWEGRILYVQDLLFAMQVPAVERLVHARNILHHMACIAAKKKCIRLQWFFPTTNKEWLAFAQTVNMVDITIKENWHQYHWNSPEFSKFLDQ